MEPTPQQQAHDLALEGTENWRLRVFSEPEDDVELIAAQREHNKRAMSVMKGMTLTYEALYQLLNALT